MPIYTHVKLPKNLYAHSIDLLYVHLYDVFFSALIVYLRHHTVYIKKMHSFSLKENDLHLSIYYTIYSQVVKKKIKKKLDKSEMECIMKVPPLG